MQLSAHRAGTTTWELLAGLRFALAAIVLTGHVRWLGAPSPMFIRFTDFCPYTAVLCFLTISGYSMAHSIAARPAGFFVRRVVRIYPLYAASVVAGLLPAVMLHWVQARTGRDVLLNLAFLQTFRSLPIVGNGVTWTLAVEVAFYALTPLLNRLPTAVLAGLTAVSAAAFAWYPNLHLPYFNELTHGLPMLFLGWAWLAGFLFYRCRRLPLAGAALVAAVVALTTIDATWAERRHELTVVATMLTVAAAAAGTRVPLWARTPLLYLGDLSFPLYLFHAPVILLLVQCWHWQNPWAVTLIALAVGGAMLAVDLRVKRPFAEFVRRIAGVGRAAAESAVGRVRPPVESPLATQAAIGVAGSAAASP